MNEVPANVVVAWVAAIGSVLTALATLWWTKGSKARIAEMNARAKLADAQAKLEEVNSREITAAYEQMLRDAESKFAIELAAVTGQLESLRRKLDACEVLHSEALARAARFEGKLEILEGLYHRQAEQLKNLSNTGSTG